MGMSEHAAKSLWELLWDYDPNGLVVVDLASPDLAVRIVNPAFCRMFGVTPDQVIGRPARAVLDADDEADFRAVLDAGRTLSGEEKSYRDRNLVARKVVFAIREQGIAAAIFVDLTSQHAQRQEIAKLRRETIAKANEVVQNQMRVAQEIAGLLGETTAETKVSLLQLIDALGQESD
jgi:PAS domain S-box-containing protein